MSFEEPGPDNNYLANHVALLLGSLKAVTQAGTSSIHKPGPSKLPNNFTKPPFSSLHTAPQVIPF